MADNEVLLLMEHITKRFSGSVALSDAYLTVARGEIHALIGENGAGKSTIIKVLTGAYQRDHGRILFDGHEIDFHAPQQAQANGISTIYQEINLVPFRSITENIFLGRELYRWGLLDWRKMNAEAAELLQRLLNISIDVTKPLNTFSTATQQMVAIARAVSFKSKLVIMDEPTSSLSTAEVEALFTVIRQLKADGVAVIFVSHRLDELYAICDGVTIMRDGATIDERPIHTINKSDFNAIGTTTIGNGFINPPLPLTIVLLFVAFIIGIAVLRYTRFGRYVLAIGGNSEASRLMGLPVKRTLMLVYTLSGALAGLAGVLLAVNRNGGSATEGNGWELIAIAAVVVGGTLLSGGVGSVFGTLIGVLLLGTIVQILQLENNYAANNPGSGLTLSSFWQDVIRGVFLLVVVLLQSQLERRKSKATI